MTMTINILGTDYEIIRCEYDDDPTFQQKGINGYCDRYAKQIVVCNMSTYPGFEQETVTNLMRIEKEVLRHEIVHAFLNESGLQSCTHTVNGPWAEDEEVIDWFSVQGLKIHQAWIEAGAV